MVQQDEPAPARRDDDRRPDELVLDQLTEQLDRTVSFLRGSPNEAAERALRRFGGQLDVEARIAARLAERSPLAAPERFPEAHRLAMHALEVLDRDGFRDPPVPRWFGPLRPAARFSVEFVAGYIVKSYAESIVSRLRSLYARREVQCERGSPQRQVLASRRVEMDRLAQIYRGGGAGAPALLAAGVVFPLFASVTGYAGAIDWTARPILLALLAAAFVLLFGGGWVLLTAAAVARRRSQLIMSQTLAALWETIGGAGDPPEDDSVLFATVAIVLTALVWIVIPAALAIVLTVD